MAADCKQVHDVVREGKPADSAELRAHIAQCDACAEVTAGGAELAAALDSSPVSPSFDALFTEVERTIEAERGVIGWLRSRPTSARLGLAAAVAVLVVVYSVVVTARADLGVYPGGRLALELVAMAAAVGIALFVALRPLHRPAWPRWVEWGAVGVVVAVGLLGPLSPVAHQAHPASLAGLGADFVPRAVSCFAFGILMAGPALLWLGVLSRRRQRFGLPTAVGVASAGVVGSTAVFMHCPLVGPTHLLAGHSTVVAAFVLLALVAGFSARGPASSE